MEFDKLMNLLQKKTSAITIFMSDNKYRDIPLIELEKQINIINNFHLLQYRSETRDCDDYAAFLYGMVKAFLGNIQYGLCWVNVYDKKTNKLIYKHAMNIFVDKSGTIWYIEPQTNSINLITSFLKENIKPFLIVM